MYYKDPTHELHTRVNYAVQSAGIEGSRAETVGSLIAYAAGGSPSAHPIEWHQEVLTTSSVTPNADNFHAMQVASFVAKQFISELRGW